MPTSSKNKSYLKIVLVIIIIGALGYVLLKPFYTSFSSGLRQNVASQILQKFINNNLQSQHYTANLTAYRTTIYPLYSERWTLNNISYIASLHFNATNGNINKLVLSVEIPLNANRTVITNIPNALFIDIKQGWRCIQTNTTEICESFWIEGTAKKGVAVISIPNRTIVQLCEIPKGSDIYNQDTCTIFR